MTSRKWIFSAAILAMSAMPAFADTQTEEFVRSNANEVLASLNEPGLNSDERRAKFQAYMDEFTNLDAVAKFVLGPYSSKFTADEMDAYLVAFRTYALAVYEFYFHEYRGQDVKVTGSQDNPRGSIVYTEIIRSDGQELAVGWRVFDRRGDYQVVDVALKSQGNTIWLGIEQRAQFKSILDRNYGSAEILIEKIESMTDDLVAQRPTESS